MQNFGGSVGTPFIVSAVGEKIQITLNDQRSKRAIS
jgi:hypothetical protein